MNYPIFSLLVFCVGFLEGWSMIQGNGRKRRPAETSKDIQNRKSVPGNRSEELSSLIGRFPSGFI